MEIRKLLDLGTGSMTFYACISHFEALCKARVETRLPGPHLKLSIVVNNDTDGYSKIAMDGDSTPRGIVDPEVRAYVYSLVSAVCTTAFKELS